MSKPTGGHEVQNYEEMCTSLESGKVVKKGSVYTAATAEKQRQITEIIAQLSSEVIAADRHGKITLKDTNAVKRQVYTYLKACTDTSSLPSWCGICRALGYSRVGVDHFLHQHSGTNEHETAVFLTIIKDAIAESLQRAALCGATNPIMSIFISKCIYKFYRQPNTEQRAC